MTLEWQLAERLQHLRTRWQYRGSAPIVIVHQMARVGSRSIRRAIREHAPGYRSFHTHYLNADTIGEMRERFVRRHQQTGRPGLYREYLHACWLARRIRRKTYGDWKIISVVRDPVARTVSAFFRHFALNHAELGERFHENPDNVPQLIELFHDAGNLEHAFTLDWFDREVRDVFGIDVYDTPFHARRGCEFACEAGRLLVLRTEDLSSTGGSTIGAFLGVGPMMLEHHNRSTDRHYSDAYRRFLKELRLSPAYLDRMYESKLARHFYSQEEVAAFRARWAIDA